MRKLVLVCAAAIMSFASAVFAAVNVNTATAEEMQEALNGVGPVKAQAIVEYREENGKFKSKSDLTKVDGVGEATLEGISGDITLGE